RGQLISLTHCVGSGWCGAGLLAGRRACGFSRRALDDPSWWLDVDLPRCDVELGDDGIAKRGFERAGIAQLVLVLGLGDDDDIFGAQVRIVEAEGHRPSVVNGRVARDDLLDVLRLDVLPRDDDHIFPPSDDIQLTVDGEPEVVGPVPAVAERLPG